MKIVKLPNGASLDMENGSSEQFTASELLRLSQDLKSFVLENASDFDELPVKEIRFRNRSFLVSISENFGFWEDLESGRWEPQTFDTFDKYIDENTVFLDIGGWIGSTTLYAAQAAKKTYAFEPDPVAHKEFQKNLELNKDADWSKRTEIIQAAISPTSGEVRLGFRDAAGDSMSSVLLTQSDAGQTVSAIDLTAFLEEKNLAGEKLFFKMDIEGYEYDVVPSLAKTLDRIPTSVFHLSLHPQFLLDSIRNEKSNTPLTSSVVRRQFYQKHKNLLNVFKNWECYYVNGKRVNKRKLMTKTIINADFPRDLVFVKNWT